MNNINKKQNNFLILRIVFIGILAGTVFIFICGKSILSLYGLTIQDVDSSIGGYVSSLLGAIAGVVLTMTGTLLLGMYQKKEEKEAERREKEDEKKEKAILLYYDLQVLFRKITCRYWMNNIEKNNISIEDQLYKDLDSIFKDINNESFQELLSNTERVKIITSLNIQNEQNKLKFINFLSSDKLKFLQDINYNLLKNYNECRKIYNEAYNYLKKINTYINLYKYDRDEFDSRYDNPLLNQITICLDLYLKDFFMEEAEKQGTKVGNAVPVVNENGEIFSIFYDDEYFEYDSLSLAIDYYKNDEKSNENEENNLEDQYREFKKTNNEKIKEKVHKYRKDLIKNIELDDTFDEVIRMIKLDNEYFWKTTNNEENYFEKIIKFNNKEDKFRKLNNISSYLEDAFLHGKEKNVSNIIVAVENGKAQYIEVELCKEVIQYRKKEYFEKCNNWDKICELFDYDIAESIFFAGRHIEYISNKDNLEFVLFPKFKECILPDNIENIAKELYSKDIKEIFGVLKEIKEIAEIEG
ncbi:hypothetical protein DIC82_17965 [Clostridium beijerinckii]|nr:hypothetical protein DIC82_17965 [Clostridium beijerinckii]